MEKEHEPTKQTSMQFAKLLADVLESGRTGNHYGKLVLVAEPRFLGELRSALSPQTTALVAAAIDKDLGNVAERDISGYLGDVIKL